MLTARTSPTRCGFAVEAVLGAKVRVPTLDGNVELSIPAGTGSGKKMRLRGKGLGPAKSRGDLYVRVGIDAPNDLTPKQRELWEASCGGKNSAAFRF